MGRARGLAMALGALATAAVCLSSVVTAPGAGASATGSADWPAYLDGPAHSSFNPDATTITPSTAGTVTKDWNWKPGAPPVPQLGYVLNSSPTVYNGVVYIGANNGTFYAIHENTGTTIWKRFFGYTTSTTCKSAAFGYFGFVSTATVARAPISGALTVYVNSPDGYLYALNATTGATRWRAVVGIPSRTVDNFMAWSSPTVANGHIYVGTASQCDSPLVYAGVKEYDQATGAETAAFYNVPRGSIGGSVWSSVTVAADGTVFETTGNGPRTNQLLGNSESIVALGGRHLHELGAWQLPASAAVGTDSDFGGSPTVFSAVLPGSARAVRMVGACNKNGYYYALRAGDLAAGPVWSLEVSKKPGGNGECIAAAAWNGHELFMAGPTTTIRGTAVNGSIRAVNPSNGAVLWASGVPGGVDATPALDGKGVLSVATYQTKTGTHALFLLDAGTGAVLKTLGAGGLNSAEFAQPVFADQYLLAATYGNGLTAYSPKVGAKLP